jgi:hypothetical protein
MDSRMAAAATLAAVLGFVIQFVGLRALHWSATIYQLGVMLIMTVVRSLVRRGLAADPIFYPLIDGHELAWLTLYMINSERQGHTHDQQTAASQHNENSASSNEERTLSVIDRLEPLSGYFGVEHVRAAIEGAIYSNGGTDAFRNSQIIEERLSRAFHPIFETWTLDSNRNRWCDTRFLDVCRDLQRLTPMPSEVGESATSLALAIERTSSLLAKSENILWKDRKHPLVADGDDLSQLSFTVHMVHGRYASPKTATLQNLRIHVQMMDQDPEAPQETDKRHATVWQTDREVLSSIISLWLFSLELRKSVLSKIAIELDRQRSRSRDPPIANGLILRRNIYFRVVASAPYLDETGDYTGLSGYAQCSRWLVARLHSLPHIGDYSQAMTVTDTYTENAELLANLWMTWGSRFSASFE